MNIPSYYPIIHNKDVKTDESVAIRNPFTGKTVGEVSLAKDHLPEEAVESALKGFERMRNLSGFERHSILQKIVEGIADRQEELAETIVAESGKPIHFARNEVERAKLTFGWAAEESRRMGGDFLPLDVAANTESYAGITRRFPIGVILGITPFNFPLNLVAHKIAPSLASGNAIILKPAPQTPITALILGDIIRSAGAPAGAVNILPTDNASAEKLVRDERIAKLSFTGSDAVGWRLKSIAGKKKVTLELGGNAGTIVEPDADLAFAMPRLALGSFAYSGQVCISVQRIYVHEEIFEEFVDRFLEEVADNIPAGDPMDPKTVVGPMIDEKSAQRALEWIAEARKNGARLLYGGSAEGALIQPTVLTDTRPEMNIICREAFAPVVSIEPYPDFSTAINILNRSDYGLQASVFTKDVEKIRQAFLRLEVGGVVVNDYPTFRIDPMPYGGIKNSGMGREGLRYAIEEMTELKLLAMRF